jgi:hypothetical protein
MIDARAVGRKPNRLDRHPETARIDHVLRLFRERDETGASTIHPAHLMVHSRVAAIGDPQLRCTQKPSPKSPFAVQ